MRPEAPTVGAAWEAKDRLAKRKGEEEKWLQN